MTVYLVISLPKLPYTHCIYIYICVVLANPTCLVGPIYSPVLQQYTSKFMARRYEQHVNLFITEKTAKQCSAQEVLRQPCPGSLRQTAVFNHLNAHAHTP
jgi:hypothetical protein